MIRKNYHHTEFDNVLSISDMVTFRISYTVKTEQGFGRWFIKLPVDLELWFDDTRSIETLGSYILRRKEHTTREELVEEIEEFILNDNISSPERIDIITGNIDTTVAAIRFDKSMHVHLIHLVNYINDIIANGFQSKHIIGLQRFAHGNIALYGLDMKNMRTLHDTLYPYGSKNIIETLMKG